MNTTLRDELLRMQAEDQHMRNTIIAKCPPGTVRTPEDSDWWQAVDTRNTARMKEIIAEHCWPTISLVGEDASNAAWLLVQHADADRAFQKQCLTLLEDAIGHDEANAANLAYLTDRVHIGEGKPQIYGTQIHQEGDFVRPLPIEDIAHIDERRKSVGLKSLREYIAGYAEQNGLPYSLEPAQRSISTIIPNARSLVQFANLLIKPGREDAVRAWWRDSAKDLAGLTARKSGSHVSNLLGLVVQSVFLDERNGQPCALLYSRLQRPAEPPPHSDEAAEQQRFFVDNFDLAALRVHEVLFDVDRIAELTADDVRCAAQDGAGTHGLTITGQVQCLRIRIQPGKLDRVREYCAALPTRDGLRDVLRDEGVLIETMCLDHTDDADYLLFYSRVENLKASGETFRQSRHLIDEEARTFMAETWELHGGVSRLEMIYDVDRIADIVDGS